MTEDLGSHVLPCFKHFLLGMHLILARPTTQAPLNATGSTKRLCAASESCLKENKRNLLQHHDDNQADHSGKGNFRFHTKLFKTPRLSKTSQHHCVNAQWLALIKALSLNMF